MKYNVQIKGDNDNKRFLLEISGEKPLVVIGVNPSKANAVESDRTVDRAMYIAEQNGYDGLLIINLYPQRTTDPTKLHQNAEEDLNRQNIETITDLVNRVTYPTVLLSYGDLLLSRVYLKENLKKILAMFPDTTKWLKMGELTVKGNPRHLSRLSYSTKVTDASDYVKHILK